MSDERRICTSFFFAPNLAISSIASVGLAAFAASSAS
jgi:hypothetical protein